jgi:hypothetical protein
MICFFFTKSAIKNPQSVIKQYPAFLFPGKQIYLFKPLGFRDVIQVV